MGAGEPNGCFSTTAEPRTPLGRLIAVRMGQDMFEGREYPKGEFVLSFGAQAIRVTHSESHDFVQFIDVEFGKTTDVAVGLHQWPRCLVRGIRWQRRLRAARYRWHRIEGQLSGFRSSRIREAASARIRSDSG